MYMKKNEMGLVAPDLAAIFSPLSAAFADWVAPDGVRCGWDARSEGYVCNAVAAGCCVD